LIQIKALHLLHFVISVAIKTGVERLVFSTPAAMLGFFYVVLFQIVFVLV